MNFTFLSVLLEVSTKNTIEQNIMKGMLDVHLIVKLTVVQFALRLFVCTLVICRKVTSRSA